MRTEEWISAGTLEQLKSDGCQNGVATVSKCVIHKGGKSGADGDRRQYVAGSDSRYDARCRHGSFLSGRRAYVRFS